MLLLPCHEVGLADAIRRGGAVFAVKEEALVGVCLQAIGWRISTEGRDDPPRKAVPVQVDLA